MERDYQFDNYKAFLIVLVVAGHFLFPLQETVPWTNTLRKVIFSFHMPAFIFISGYFARKNEFGKLVQKLLIPYLVMQTGIWFLQENVGSTGAEFRLLQPYFTLWFLICLFFWRLSIEQLSKVRGILFLAFAAGILAGFDRKLAETLSLSRMVVFFPYFLLGYRFNKEKFMEYTQKRWVKILAVAGILVIFLLITLAAPEVKMRHFLFREGYPKRHLIKGAVIRALLYVTGCTLTYLFLIIMPQKRHWFSWLGMRTMSVYLFHGILELAFEVSPFVEYFKTDTGGILLILMSIGLTLLLATKPFVWAAEKICGVPVGWIVKE